MRKSLGQKLRSPRFWLRGVNAALRPLNLRMETLTAARQEMGRLNAARERGWFARPAFTTPVGFHRAEWRSIVEGLKRHLRRFGTFEAAHRNDVAYQFDNPFFSSPDAEVLYVILRERQPRRLVEIGSGHSTRVARQAVIDGAFPCEIVSVDPRPRRDVAGFADVVHRVPIETLDPVELADGLATGDVLFVDASHEVRAGNDSAFIFGTLLPRLRPGVIVHIHDVFLPWDYPEDIVFRRGSAGWGEQYVLHALLCGRGWDVWWPGYWLQKSEPDFATWFPHLNGSMAQSLWMAKT